MLLIQPLLRPPRGSPREIPFIRGPFQQKAARTSDSAHCRALGTKERTLIEWIDFS